MGRRLRKLAIGYEQLRSVMIEYLAEAKDDPTLQINSLRTGVAVIAVRRGLDPDAAHASSPAHGIPSGFGSDVVLSDADFSLVGEVMWDLIIEGVLRPGSSTGSQVFPHFHLTERGVETVKQGMASPYDPEQYAPRSSEAQTSM